MKKPGVSTLNPYAAVYIPLSKRGPDDNKIGFTGADAIQTSNQTVWYGPADHLAQNRQHDKSSFVPEISTMKSYPAYGYYGSSSHNSGDMVKKQVVDDEFDMDLEYLQMTFPGISDESLTGVYMANKGDLGATVDMLNDLEFDTLESSENLPDTLDIGDVSESGSNAESSSLKMKNVAGEPGASSSGSSAPDKVVIT